MSRGHLPTWKNPGGALCRVMHIDGGESLPTSCPECGDSPARWLDQGENEKIYPKERTHDYLCARCRFMLIERRIGGAS